LKNEVNVTKTLKFNTDSLITEQLWLGAVSRGYVFGTKELKIEVSCGLEKVLSRYTTEYFPFQVTENTGIINVQRNQYSDFFLSSQPQCGVTKYAVEAHKPSDFSIATPITPTFTDVPFSDFASVNNAFAIAIDSSKIKPGSYIFDLVATTESGASARAAVLIEVKGAP